MCEAEGCGFDEPAGDLDRYPVTTEVTEEARQAALAAAVAPLPKKRAPRRKAEAPATEGHRHEPKAKGGTGKRPAGKRPTRPAAAARTSAGEGRQEVAPTGPKRRPTKK